MPDQFYLEHIYSLLGSGRENTLGMSLSNFLSQQWSKNVCQEYVFSAGFSFVHTITEVTSKILAFYISWRHSHDASVQLTKML
jgi:hypothetical protein